VLAAILTIIVAALLRLPILLNPQPYEIIESAPLSVFTFNFINTFENHFLIKYIVALILIVIQALLLNYIFVRHDVLYKITYLPGFVYVVLCSVFPQQMQLTPQLIANTFLLLMLLRIFYLYESINPLLLVLDAGVYIGVGFLFHYDIIFFMPFVLISVIIFTSFNIRYILVALLGILLPVYFISVYYYVTYQFKPMMQVIINRLTSIEIVSRVNDYTQLIPVGIVAITALFGYFGLQQNYFKNKVKTRRILQSFLLLSGFGVLVIFIENEEFIYSSFHINIALSLPVGYYFISKKRYWLKEVILYLLIGFSIYFSLTY
jgi:hypothetical protein